MDFLTLKKAIKDKYSSIADVAQVTEYPWFEDGESGLTWRDTLLNTYQIRLSHAKRCSPETKDVEILVSEASRFVGLLKLFGPEDRLYWFSAQSRDLRFSGWIINLQIAFCIPGARLV